eukprot:9957366-Lingulodinium_polyedra.AAC.1
MECARVRFTSRRGGGRSIRPHHCARFLKPCAMLRSKRLSTTTAARKSHARVLHANSCLHGIRARAI